MRGSEGAVLFKGACCQASGRRALEMGKVMREEVKDQEGTVFVVDFPWAAY